MFALFPRQQRSVCLCGFRGLSSPLSHRASGLGGAGVSVLSQAGDAALAWALALSCPGALLEELLCVPGCVQQLLSVLRARRPCWPRGDALHSAVPSVASSSSLHMGLWAKESPVLTPALPHNCFCLFI